MSAERSPWISSAEAAAILCTTVSSFSSLELKHGLRHRAHHGRWLWYRPDVEAVAHIRQECRVGATAAIRVLVAAREHRLKLAVIFAHADGRKAVESR